MFFASGPGKATFTDLSPLEASQRLAEFRVIDVREPHECASATGIIAGAENVPLAGVADAAATWPPHAPLLLVCRSGARSSRAAATLAGLGFDQLFNLAGGMLAWNERGLPITHP